MVDNASTDSTPAVFDSVAGSAPFPARRVAEPRLGESFARNRAIDEARGDFLLFIDDDAVAEPDWAAALVGEIERRSLDAVCGMVLARWMTEPPRWLGARLNSKLAVHDPRAIERGPRAAVETLSNYFGANMAFRRSAFERFGRFREDLGVIGGNAISGADTDFFSRIIARGGRVGFAPGALVHHMIGPERTRRAYLLKKSFAYGVGSAFAGGVSHNRLDKLAKNAVRMAAAALRGDGEGVMYHGCECANFFGYWRGRIARATKPRAASLDQIGKQAAP